MPWGSPKFSKGAILYKRPPVGMPTSTGAPEAHRPTATAPTGLPPVLKSEKASEVILKYMEGVLKRSQKIGDSWLPFLGLAPGHSGMQLVKP